MDKMQETIAEEEVKIPLGDMLRKNSEVSSKTLVEEIAKMLTNKMVEASMNGLYRCNIVPNDFRGHFINSPPIIGQLDTLYPLIVEYFEGEGISIKLTDEPNLYCLRCSWNKT